jgi:hypothetical protein
MCGHTCIGSMCMYSEVNCMTDFVLTRSLSLFHLFISVCLLCICYH